MRQVHIVCGGVLGEGRFEIFIVQFDHNRQGIARDDERNVVPLVLGKTGCTGLEWRCR